MTIINLFEESGAVHQFEQPSALLERMKVHAASANKALVVLINDRAGTWSVDWESSGMNNSEVMMAMNIINRLMMDSILS